MTVCMAESMLSQYGAYHSDIVTLREQIEDLRQQETMGYSLKAMPVKVGGRSDVYKDSVVGMLDKYESLHHRIKWCLRIIREITGKIESIDKVINKMLFMGSVCLPTNTIMLKLMQGKTWTAVAKILRTSAYSCKRWYAEGLEVFAMTWNELEELGEIPVSIAKSLDSADVSMV